MIKVKEMYTDVKLSGRQWWGLVVAQLSVTVGKRIRLQTVQFANECTALLTSTSKQQMWMTW